jgi:hypothetical protein
MIGVKAFVSEIKARHQAFFVKRVPLGHFNHQKRHAEHNRDRQKP